MRYSDRRGGRRLDAEGAAAAAGALDVGVVELETGAFDGLDVIDLDAVEVHLAHLVDQNLEALEFVHVVRGILGVVKSHVVAEPGTAAAYYSDAQRDSAQGSAGT